MQFGVFTIGDITADPTNGTAPTEHPVSYTHLRAHET